MIADFLELEVDKNFPKTKLVTASGIIEVPVKILDKIQVGNLVIKNLHVVIHKISDPA